MRKIWTNSSPTSNFSATTLDLSSYSMKNGIVIYYKGHKSSTGDSYFHYMFIKPDGKKVGLSDYHATGYLWFRNFTLSTNKILTITTGYQTNNLSFSSSQATATTAYIIPLEIYTI